MDAISDRVFTKTLADEESYDDPSLLTIILDVAPQGWFALKDITSVSDIAKALLVFLNAHLALNNSNQVSFIVSSPLGSRFLYPNPDRDYDNNAQDPSLVNPGMYRQFRLVDETVVKELNKILHELSEYVATPPSEFNGFMGSTLAGALSMGLTYTNRMFTLDPSINTTTASAINSTTAGGISGTSAGPGEAGGSGMSTAAVATNITSMKSRIVVVLANTDEDILYIPLMNAIFTAQKLKVSIDVAKLGQQGSAFLQQAADATNGVYLNIEDPSAIIQILSSAFFVEPSIRPFLILPTNTNVNYRASCFLTGKSVDIGYVCSVCICIMSIIPPTGQCPACGSKFDTKILDELQRRPVVVSRKKRKTDATEGQSQQ